MKGKKGVSLFAKHAKKEAHTIEITKGEWVWEHWKELIHLDSFNSTIRMFLQNNEHQDILMEICDVPLSGLLILNLSNNRITSLYAIADLQCPNLQKLDISYNLICCVRPLGNCLIQTLKELRIQMNPIYDFYPLTLMAAQVHNLILTNFNQKKDFCCWDTSFIAKLKIALPRKIMCGSSASLTPSKCKQMIAQKYKSLLLYDTLWM